MKKITITVQTEKDVKQISGETQHTILRHLNKQHDITIAAPCGGKGTCGKCKIRLLSGSVSELTGTERDVLTETERKNGVRLACLTYPLSDVEISVIENGAGGSIKKDIPRDALHIEPAYQKHSFRIVKPHLDDQRDDLRRLMESAGCAESTLPLSDLNTLPALLREADYSITVFSKKNDDEGNRILLSVEKGDTCDSFYGVSIDIGTTTVAAYLVLPHEGKTIDVVSALNSQSSFGADVVSRIAYANEHGLDSLHQRIIGQINSLISELAERNSISVNEIYSVYIAGNTTMIHLFLGIDPGKIAVTPFIPVLTKEYDCPARDLGISINNAGEAVVLPSISAYVGADITAAILASGMQQEDGESILIDIGTNGEIALGDQSSILCCSTAAGPAFEGANIRFGTGGIAGAIDSVKTVTQEDTGDIAITTIENADAVGICGSGIVDVIAILLDYRILDETGRLLPPEELGENVPDPIRRRMFSYQDAPAFLISGAVDGNTETYGRHTVFITQKDIREIQLAKSAIAAGIATLLHHRGIDSGNVSRIYLTGGFGTFINKEHAVRIGLLPYELRQKIRTIGNAAGIGTVMAQCSFKRFRSSNAVKNKVKYIELSSSSEFQDLYMEHMLFPGH
jgi:uncharacterized 2Fe-2S/4Fe-4S cluster protein (DUF4445 family)